MKNLFSVGDKVVEKKNIQPRTSYNILQVVGSLNGALLTNQYGCGYQGEHHADDFEDVPGSRSWRSAIEQYQEEELVSLDEALIEQQKLEANKSKLDEEFEKVKPLIRKRLDEAAALVKEARLLVNPFDRTFYDLKIECTTLYQALDDGGWSHSHMSC